MAGVQRALVLGGGGVTGIAWELGLLAGLAEAGLDLSTADVVLGTSAGSVVGAQITSGVALELLYDRQLAGYGRETAPHISKGALLHFGLAVLTTRDGERFRRRVGQLALRTPTMPEAERLAVIADRLPEHEWPARDLRVTAVDAHSGELRILDRTSGVPLVTAVAASCAVPGVYPPITIGDRVYVDGGVRSGTNADLVAGAEAVVVLAPVPRATGPATGVAEHLAELRRTGRAVAVSPDDAARQSIGRNPMDPGRRADAAKTGRAQAAAALDEVAAAWGKTG